MSENSFSVSEKDAGSRVDLFLAHNLRRESRSAVQKLIEEGLVLVNGQPSKPSYKLRSADLVVVLSRAPRPDMRVLEPWEFPLEILYEDDELLAINKPAGVITHPGAGNHSRTIANAIAFMRPGMRQVGHPLRPGIVHRLDRETSGVLLLAKTQQTYHALSGMFKDRKLEKHYRAVCYGTFARKNGKIDKALGRDPHDRKKVSVHARKSRSAVTLFQVLKQWSFAALLDVKILTGRTHQIRVHLSSEHHPIVGDVRYGGGSWTRIPDPALRTRLKLEQFFGLHALSLDLIHPGTNLPLHLEAPLPQTWADFT